ncbi:MAG: hypothetical protein HY975_02660 [Candidatus Kerfeldbacteria bacterium]|nr:hypothetical protein [Candidatus Kerfeldbacteria bacterium]
MDRLGRWTTLIAVLGLLFCRPVQAADRLLTFAGPVGAVREGQSFSVDVRLTNHAQTINALDITIQYPSAMLELVSIHRQQSALTLWPEEPSWDPGAGSIHLVGGVPHGLYADNARVVTLTFTATAAGSAVLSFDSALTRAFFNDGQGTSTTIETAPNTVEVSSALLPTITVTSPSHPSSIAWYAQPTAVIQWPVAPATQNSYAWSADDQVVPDDVPDEATGSITYPNLADGRYSFTIKSRADDSSWSPIVQYWVQVDTTAPDSFALERLTSATVGGQPVVHWAANDRQSGIQRMVAAVNGKEVGSVTSPLTLKPGWIGKKLTITVYDYAGNSRSATLAATSSGLLPVLWWLIGLAALVAGGAAAWHLARRRTR